MTIVMSANRCYCCTNSNRRKVKTIRSNVSVVSVSLLLLVVGFVLLLSPFSAVAFHINNYNIIQPTTIITTSKAWRNKQLLLVPVKKSNLVSLLLSSTTNYNNNKNVQILLPMYGSGKDSIRSSKKNIVIIGCGGYTGSLVFGYLQRCLSLSSSTGIKSIRVLGSTADTSIRLNRFLSSKFCLAYANEMYLKLINLYTSTTNNNNAIQKNLLGYDAIVFGLDNLFIQQRTVTPGTYDITPNDKTWELYWGSPQGSFSGNNNNENNNSIQIQQTIISNIIKSAQQANIQHAFVLVANDNENTLQSNPNYIELLQSNIPYTIICTSSESYTIGTPNYTFKSGIQTPTISITKKSSSTTTADVLQPIPIEDLAAVCVQCIQSLDWTKSRIINVSKQQLQQEQESSLVPPTIPKSSLRPDQEWCVNSYILRNILATIE